MGSFSWNRADNLGEIENIYAGCPFKMLIPKEFGGGFIKDNYQDYGRITDHNTGKTCDMYELIAFWNYKQLKTPLTYKGDRFPLMKEQDEFTDGNRGRGIEIGCYDRQIDNLEYPLKLVSEEFEGTYEDCGPSYGDPDQGFYPRRRDGHTVWDEDEDDFCEVEDDD